MPDAIDRDIAKLERMFAAFHAKLLKGAADTEQPRMKLTSAIDIVLSLAERSVLENLDAKQRQQTMEATACQRVRRALPEIKALPEPMPVIVTARKPGRRDGDPR